MNKPAPKEPSMDEILSSIRQIIADDDAAVAPRKPTQDVAAARPVPPRIPQTADDELEPIAPLALSAEQIVRDEKPAEVRPPEPISFEALLAEDADSDEIVGEPQLVDPEDISFDEPEEAIIVPEPEPVRREPVPVPRSFAPEPVVAPPITPVEPLRPRVVPQSVAEAAPMPDPDLSSDLAEQLLAPTTDMAVKSAFSRLGNIGLGVQGTTIEGMIREMLRPMLKDWLDENLPAVVERMVEKEIGRISRGID